MMLICLNTLIQINVIIECIKFTYIIIMTVMAIQKHF